MRTTLSTTSLTPLSPLGYFKQVELGDAETRRRPACHSPKTHWRAQVTLPVPAGERVETIRFPVAYSTTSVPRNCNVRAASTLSGIGASNSRRALLLEASVRRGTRPTTTLRKTNLENPGLSDDRPSRAERPQGVAARSRGVADGVSNADRIREAPEPRAAESSYRLPTNSLA